MIDRGQLHVTRKLWWTCAAVLAAQLVILPIAYFLTVFTVGVSALFMEMRPMGFFVGVPCLVAGLGAVLLGEYGAGLLAASAMRHYLRGLHDLPARRIALGALAGLCLGVIAVQALDAWEGKLRGLGIPDTIQFVCRVGALIGPILAGGALGARAWAKMKRAGQARTDG